MDDFIVGFENNLTVKYMHGFNRSLVDSSWLIS